MSRGWIVVALLGVATIAFKAAGPVLVGRRELPPRLRACVDLLAPVMLTALVVTQTFGGDGELEIDARVQLHLQLNLAADETLEARLLDFHRIVSRRERRERITPRVVGGRGARGIGSGVGGDYRGADDRCAAAITHLAADRAERLSEGGVQAQQKAHHYE